MHIMEELIYEFKYLILLLNIFRKEMKLFIKVKDMKTLRVWGGGNISFTCLPNTEKTKTISKELAPN